ncbi:YfhO family protein [Candidatus Woesearchaeota archaeon]|nr:YfhO family protein [Candidatus Woesearchaeota archaeon]
MSLIYRQPFILSPVITKSHLFHPERLEYRQDGSGGSVEKYICADGINDRETSALLIPSSRGNSTLRVKYQDKQLDKLRGYYVRVFVMVKSQNKTPDAIQVKMHDGTGAEVSKSYGNSGDWECLELSKFIGDYVRHLRLTCSIKSTGTAGVYFNWIKVLVTDKPEVIPYKNKDYSSEFEAALNSKRWSSFLLPRQYFDLIHSDIPFPALVEMFAVDKPVFQFKKEFIQVKENEISDFLNQLGSTKAVKLLKDATIIVDEKPRPSLRGLGISKEKYNKDQFLSYTNFSKAGSVSGINGEREFEYSIERYEYDSCDIRISANTDGILYWADGYDKGWHAYVNKEEVPVYRANKNFKAIAIPKGTSYINFIYDPYLFKVGLTVFYGTFIVSILAATIFISFCNIRKANGQNKL